MSEAKQEVPLPKEGCRNILITSALPYVNNVPHLGNLIGCVLSADVYSRFTRLRGHNSIYICGTDEYGTATEMRARKEGVTPQDICEKYYKIHKEIYEWFDIDFSIFGRTSTPEQTKITQDIFKRLEKNGHTVEKDVEQLTCDKCGPLADRYVSGTCPICTSEGAHGDQCDSCGNLLNAIDLKNPKCKECKAIPIIRSSRHIFIKLPQLTPALKEWVDVSSVKGGWSTNSIRTTNAWIKKGLEDRCITRDLSWGTKIPKEGYEDKVFYVWFDAPIGYLSITANLTDQWEQWWKNKNVELVQFMGKDNVPFHTVIFPSTLIGVDDGYTLLHHISTTEYLNYETGKFSKTFNRGVFGDDAMATKIAPEIWRYYLLTMRPETADTEFNWDDLRVKNRKLLGNVGNFVNRSLTLLTKYFDGEQPEIHPNEDDEEFIRELSRLKKKYISELEDVKIKSALQTAQDLSDIGNGYIQRNKPWDLVKGGFWEVGGKTRCATVVGITLNLVKTMALLLAPYMPSLTEQICKQINVETSSLKLDSDEFSLGIPVGHKINKPVPIIRDITPEEISEYRSRFSGARDDEKDAPEFPLDLVVGTVTNVEDHPHRDHLWVLKVKFSDDEGTTRQVVTNLKQSYQVADILGKKVICLNNIKKEKFAKVTSEAMLMCAQDDSGYALLTSDAPDGTRATPTGANVKVKPNFKYKKLGKKLNLNTDENSVPRFGDLDICVNGAPVSLSSPKPNARIV